MLKELRKNKWATCNWICALLMIVLLVMQFVPFWHFGEAGESCSISSYVWFPSDYKDLESWLDTQAEGHDLNSFVGMPILVLVLSAVGAALCLIKPDKGMTTLLPALCGAAGTWAYLTTPALKLGAGWAWHLRICIALLALGIYSLMQWAKEMKN